MKGLNLPLFPQPKKVTKKLRLFDTPDGTRYEIIICWDFQQTIGKDIFNGDPYFSWYEVQVTMVDMWYWNDTTIYHYQCNISIEKTRRLLCSGTVNGYQILETIYVPVNGSCLCMHLWPDNCQQIYFQKPHVYHRWGYTFFKRHHNSGQCS